MAYVVLPGGIAKGIRKIEKGDSEPTILLSSGRCWLVITECGDTRSLRIGKEVAEILIANGMPYGN